MNRVTTARGSLAVALLLGALIPLPASAAPVTAARPVEPPIHALKAGINKAGNPVALKPANPPRRAGPIIKLDAAIDARGAVELDCEMESEARQADATGEQQ